MSADELSDKFFTATPGAHRGNDELYYHVRDPGCGHDRIADNQEHFVAVKRHGSVAVEKYGPRVEPPIYCDSLEAALALCVLLG